MFDILIYSPYAETAVVIVLHQKVYAEPVIEKGQDSMKNLKTSLCILIH